MSDNRHRRLGILATIGYVATVVAANWAVHRFGAVHVGFGLLAPAGVYAVSAALVLRDLVQWTLGKAVMLGALAVGVAVSYWVADGRIAPSSGRRCRRDHYPPRRP